MAYTLDPYYARRTGRTTRIAINIVDQMLKNPGKRFEVLDHEGTPKDGNYLLYLIGSVTRTLGIPCIVEKNDRTGTISVHVPPIGNQYDRYNYETFKPCRL